MWFTLVDKQMDHEDPTVLALKTHIYGPYETDDQAKEDFRSEWEECSCLRVLEVEAPTPRWPKDQLSMSREMVETIADSCPNEVIRAAMKAVLTNDATDLRKYWNL